MIDTQTLLEKLIACPSITPQDANCQTIIKDLLIDAGFHVETMRFQEVDNLWATKGKQSPLLVLAGHTDVVPPGPLENWQSPPFTPSLRDGYLYGRGACDMKGALAAMLVAACKFVRDKPNFTGTLGFLITSDEEGASIHGTQEVIAHLSNRGIAIKYAIVGEPSSEKTIGDQIRIGRRGSLHAKLTIYGKQGHVAHPHLADNPIHRSMCVLHDLANTEWDQGNNDFPPTTFQITNIHSGTGALNVIPPHIEIAFNFRYSTAVTIDQLMSQTEAILNKIGLNYDIEWRVGAYPFLTHKGKLLEETIAAIKTITGQDTRLSTGGGTSDARFIAPTGAEIIELGVSHSTAHQINECVSITDLTILTNIYYTLLTKML